MLHEIWGEGGGGVECFEDETTTDLVALGRGQTVPDDASDSFHCLDADVHAGIVQTRHEQLGELVWRDGFLDAVDEEGGAEVEQLERGEAAERFSRRDKLEKDRRE